MSRLARPRRNDPCPCGSGKKYKRCCLTRPEVEDGEAVTSSRFRFEPGSYGEPGAFMASIACLKRTTSEGWQYHFVLVQPEIYHGQEREAAAAAEEDLEQAFRRRGSGGSALIVAEHLKAAGYLSVEGFQVVDD